MEGLFGEVPIILPLKISLLLEIDEISLPIILSPLLELGKDLIMAMCYLASLFKDDLLLGREVLDLIPSPISSLEPRENITIFSLLDL